MNFINSWTSKNKQWDKIALKIRIGRITLFDLYLDRSRKQAGIIIFNFGIKRSNEKDQFIGTGQNTAPINISAKRRID
jgi:hypothetical protein